LLLAPIKIISLIRKNHKVLVTPFSLPCKCLVIKKVAPILGFLNHQILQTIDHFLLLIQKESASFKRQFKTPQKNGFITIYLQLTIWTKESNFAK
jgi:hypothetical protein